MIIHLELIFDRLEEKKFPNLKLVTRPIILFTRKIDNRQLFGRKASTYFTYFSLINFFQVSH